jgi:hypothetical protein
MPIHFSNNPASNSSLGIARVLPEAARPAHRLFLDAATIAVAVNATAKALGFKDSKLAAMTAFVGTIGIAVTPDAVRWVASAYNNWRNPTLKTEPADRPWAKGE